MACLPSPTRAVLPWYAIPPLVAALWDWASRRRGWARGSRLAGLRRWLRRPLAGPGLALGYLRFGHCGARPTGTIVYPRLGLAAAHAVPEADLAHEVGMLLSAQRRVEDLLGLADAALAPSAARVTVVPPSPRVLHRLSSPRGTSRHHPRPWFRDGYREVAFAHPEIAG
jgi:hypothetical protein